jgi:glucose/arabinose dehydrogenase
MRWEHKHSARIVSLTLALCLCGVPELMAAQAQSPAAPPASQTTRQNQQPLPDAPSASPAPQSNGNTPQNQSQGQKPPAQPAQAPAGTGAAEAGPTAGGPGSKPAGMAIAPAKQHQVRSFLIKLGAIAGGAVAIGTVYALSRSSPSRPPGAK